MIQRYDLSYVGGHLCGIEKDATGEFVKLSDAESDKATELAEKDKEIERLSKRDGNASIELCYDDGFNPFARSDCKHLDFGVADNCYVVESELLNKTLEENKRLRDMCSRMDLQLRELLMSADCEWENKRQGHDWAEACESTRELLAAYNAMKRNIRRPENDTRRTYKTP